MVKNKSFVYFSKNARYIKQFTSVSHVKKTPCRYEEQMQLNMLKVTTQIKTTTTTTKRCIRESACSPQKIDKFAFQYLFQKDNSFVYFYSVRVTV